MGFEDTLIICVTVLAIALIAALITKRTIVNLAELDNEKKLRTYELNNQAKVERERIAAQAYRGIPGDDEEDDDPMSMLRQWLPVIMPYLTPEGQKAATALAGGMTEPASFLAALAARPPGNQDDSLPIKE